MQMKCVFALACLALAAVVVVDARPQFGTLFNGMNLHGSTVPVSPDRPHSYAHHFHHVDEFGSHTHFEYDVTLKQEAHHLDHDTSVEDVACDADSITVTFSDGDALSSWNVGDLVSGGAEWGCTDASGVPRAIHRLIKDIGAAAGNVVRMTTTQAAMQDFIQDGSFKLTTNSFVKQAPPTDESGAARRRLMGLGSWNAQKGISKDFTWNYGGSQDFGLYGGGSGSVSCKSCSASLDLQVDISCAISDFRMTSAKATASGTATLSAGLEVQAHYGWSKSYSKNLGTITGPTIPFSIGPVPCSIATSLPVAAVFSVSASVAGSYTVTGSLQGSLTLGAQWNGGWSPINTENFHPSESAVPFAQISGNAKVTLNTGINLIADGIVDFEFGVSPWVQANFQVGSNGCGGVEYWANAGSSFSVKAGLDLSIDGHSIINDNWGPHGVGSVGPWTVVPNRCATSFRRHLLQSSDSSSSSGSDDDSAPVQHAVAVPAACPNGCSGNGACNVTECVCATGWMGAGCDAKNYTFAHIAGLPAGTLGQVQVGADTPTECYSECSIASGLKYCAAHNGMGVCANSSALMDIDARVGSLLANFTSSGGACLDAMASRFCQMVMPVCETRNNAIVPRCYSSCINELQVCSFDNETAHALCEHSTVGSYPLVSHSSKTDGCRHTSNHTGYTSCTTAASLVTCSHLNGLNLTLHNVIGSSLLDADREVERQLAGLTGECRDETREFLCDKFLMRCDTRSGVVNPQKVCHATCLDMMSACGGNHSECHTVPAYTAVVSSPNSGCVQAEELSSLVASSNPTSPNNANTIAGAPALPVIILSAGCGVLFLVVVGLGIALIRKKRTEDTERIMNANL